MEEKIKRLISWSKGKPQGPTQIQVHFTNFCNLKCFFCPTRTLLKGSEIKKDKELTKKDWLRLVEESKQLGAKEWHICGGGEPLFDQDLACDVMLKIKKEGLYGEIITNGTLFTESIIKNLVTTGWDKITFSIDSYKSKTHNKIRNMRNVFEKAIKNIQLLNKIKKKYSLEKPYVCLHMVICNLNYKDIKGMIKLAKRIGANCILINALNLWSKDIKKLQLNDKQKKELKQELKKAKDTAKKLKIDTNIDSFLNSDLFESANIMNKTHISDAKQTQYKEQGLVNAVCFSPWFNISIFADGKAQPCFLLQEEGGSVKDKTLEKVWFGEYFEKKRKGMLKLNLNKDCSRCNPWSLEINRRIRDKLMTE